MEINGRLSERKVDKSMNRMKGIEVDDRNILNYKHVNDKDSEGL